MCKICRKPIDCEEEDFVIVDKHEVKYDNQRISAHAECAKK